MREPAESTILRPSRFGRLIVDSSGNLYGSTAYGTPGPAVFEFPPSGGGWTYQELYRLQDSGSGAGEYAPLAMDSAGNLYGTTYGYYNGFPTGTVFELTPAGGSWSYDLLHQFDVSDGQYPTAGVAFDASGNLYGTPPGGWLRWSRPRFGKLRRRLQKHHGKNTLAAHDSRNGNNLRGRLV